MKIKNEKKYIIRRLMVVGIIICILLFINNIHRKQAPKWEFVEHVIRPGDTVWDINQHLETGLSWRETLYYLDIDNPDYDGYINPGDTLIFRINVNNI